MSETSNILVDMFIFLSAAVIAVPLAKKFGLGGVLGYLLAGIVIGPWVLKLVQDEESIMHFAEFGVVMMLFLIGLELRPQLLWNMKKAIFGLGSLQILITAGLIFSLVYYYTDRPNASIIIGLVFALSSTAVAMQILNERKLMKTYTGQASFSVLLMQDIAVVPILALASILGPVQKVTEEGMESKSLTENLIMLGTIALVIIVARYVFKYIFRIIAKTEVREIFTAFSLLIVVGFALLMSKIGVSMALGTFIAGVLLAESEYRHEVEADIEPFKALLLGLFFITVGMSINFAVIMANPLLVLCAVLAVMAIKMFVLWVLARPFQLFGEDRAIFAICLSQVSEFAFVVLGMSKSTKLITSKEADLLTAIIALSMIITPILMLISSKVFTRVESKKEDRPFDNINEQNSVIIAGFGRFGQIVGRMLHAHGYNTTILDHDANHIEVMRNFGFKVFYGDASRVDLLLSAGADKAKIFVLAIDDPEASVKTLEVIKKNFPNLKIVARSRNREHTYRLINMGIKKPFRETFDSALLMAEETMKLLGFHPYEARRAAQKFRAHDEKYLFKMAGLVEGDIAERDNLIANSRAELEALFRDDEADYRKANFDGWETQLDSITSDNSDGDTEVSAAYSEPTSVTGKSQGLDEAPEDSVPYRP